MWCLFLMVMKILSDPSAGVCTPTEAFGARQERVSNHDKKQGVALKSKGRLGDRPGSHNVFKLRESPKAGATAPHRVKPCGSAGSGNALPDSNNAARWTNGQSAAKRLTTANVQRL